MGNFRGKFYVKMIALVVALVFLHQQIVWAEGGPAPAAMPAAMPASENTAIDRESVNACDIDLPYNLAHRDSAYTGDSEETIIHLQDAHASLSAQYSLVNLLDVLATDYDLEFIALEGTEGVIDTSLLKSFPDKDIREKTADLLMREGRMSAGEFFQITRDEKDIMLCGVEDNELYKENLDGFCRVIEQREPLVKMVKAFRLQISALEEKVYSEELRAFLYKGRAHKNGTLSFSDYWRDIRPFLDKFKIETKTLRDMPLLTESIELERKIDFEKANTERTDLISDLTSRLEKRELEALVLESVNFKEQKVSPANFHKYLGRLAEENNINMSSYKNFSMFTEYISLYESVDIFNLYSEVESLEKTIRDKLYRTDDERQLNEISVMTELLRGLYSIELSSRDFGFFETRREKYDAKKFAAFLRDKCGEYNVSIEKGYDLAEMLGGINSAADFYKTAAQRDRLMIENTLKRMKSEKKHVAALITGGYHTKGLTQIMKENKLSYLIISPKFEKDEERPYVAVLTGKKKPYQELIETGKYQIMAAAWNNPHDGVVDTALKTEKTVLLARGISEISGNTKKDWEEDVEVWNDSISSGSSVELFNPDEFEKLLKTVESREIDGAIVTGFKDGDPRVALMLGEDGKVQQVGVEKYEGIWKKRTGKIIPAIETIASELNIEIEAGEVEKVDNKLALPQTNPQWQKMDMIIHPVLVVSEENINDTIDRMRGTVVGVGQDENAEQKRIAEEIKRVLKVRGIKETELNNKVVEKFITAVMEELKKRNTSKQIVAKRVVKDDSVKSEIVDDQKSGARAYLKSAENVTDGPSKTYEDPIEPKDIKKSFMARIEALLARFFYGATIFTAVMLIMLRITHNVTKKEERSESIAVKVKEVKDKPVNKTDDITVKKDNARRSILEMVKKGFRSVFDLIATHKNLILVMFGFVMSLAVVAKLEPSGFVQTLERVSAKPLFAASTFGPIELVMVIMAIALSIWTFLNLNSGDMGAERRFPILKILHNETCKLNIIVAGVYVYQTFIQFLVDGAFTKGVFLFAIATAALIFSSWTFIEDGLFARETDVKKISRNSKFKDINMAVVKKEGDIRVAEVISREEALLIVVALVILKINLSKAKKNKDAEFFKASKEASGTIPEITTLKDYALMSMATTALTGLIAYFYKPLWDICFNLPMKHGILAAIAVGLGLFTAGTVALTAILSTCVTLCTVISMGGQKAGRAIKNIFRFIKAHLGVIIPIAFTVVLWSTITVAATKTGAPAVTFYGWSLEEIVVLGASIVGGVTAAVLGSRSARSAGSAQKTQEEMKETSQVTDSDNTKSGSTKLNSKGSAGSDFFVALVFISLAGLFAYKLRNMKCALFFISVSGWFLYFALRNFVKRDVKDTTEESSTEDAAPKESRTNDKKSSTLILFTIMLFMVFMFGYRTPLVHSLDADAVKTETSQLQKVPRKMIELDPSKLEISGKGLSLEWAGDLTGGYALEVGLKEGYKGPKVQMIVCDSVLGSIFSCSKVPTRGGILRFDLASNDYERMNGGNEDPANVTGIKVSLDSDHSSEEVKENIESIRFVPSTGYRILRENDGQTVKTSSHAVSGIEWEEGDSSWKVSLDVTADEMRGPARYGRIYVDFDAKKYAKKKRGKPVKVGIQLEEEFTGVNGGGGNGIWVALVRKDKKTGEEEYLSESSGGFTGKASSGKLREYSFKLPKEGLEDILVMIRVDCFNKPVNGNVFSLRLGLPKLSKKEILSASDKSAKLPEGKPELERKSSKRLVSQEIISKENVNLDKKIVPQVETEPEKKELKICGNTPNVHDSACDVVVLNPQYGAIQDEWPKEIYFDYWGDITGYDVEIVFTEQGKKEKTRIEILLKNKKYINMSSDAVTPDEDGIIRFNPVKVEGWLFRKSMAKAQAKFVKNIAAISIKFPDSDAQEGRDRIEEIRFVRKGIKKGAFSKSKLFSLAPVIGLGALIGSFIKGSGVANAALSAVGKTGTSMGTFAFVPYVLISGILISTMAGVVIKGSSLIAFFHKVSQQETYAEHLKKSFLLSLMTNIVIAVILFGFKNLEPLALQGTIGMSAVVSVCIALVVFIGVTVSATSASIKGIGKKLFNKKEHYDLASSALVSAITTGMLYAIWRNRALILGTVKQFLAQSPIYGILASIGTGVYLAILIYMAISNIAKTIVKLWKLSIGKKHGNFVRLAIKGGISAVVVGTLLYNLSLIKKGLSSSAFHLLASQLSFAMVGLGIGVLCVCTIYYAVRFAYELKELYKQFVSIEKTEKELAMKESDSKDVQTSWAKRLLKKIKRLGVFAFIKKHSKLLSLMLVTAISFFAGIGVFNAAIAGAQDARSRLVLSPAGGFLKWGVLLVAIIGGAAIVAYVLAKCVRLFSEEQKETDTKKMAKKQKKKPSNMALFTAIMFVVNMMFCWIPKVAAKDEKPESLPAVKVTQPRVPPGSGIDYVEPRHDAGIDVGPRTPGGDVGPEPRYDNGVDDERVKDRTPRTDVGIGEEIVPLTGWDVETYYDSQGIVDVYEEGGILMIVADMEGQNKNTSKGEVYRYFDEVKDFTGKKESFKIRAPEKYAFNKENGVTPFMEDVNGNKQYADRTKVTQAGEWIIVEMVPMPYGRARKKENAGRFKWTDPGFNPYYNPDTGEGGIVKVGIKLVIDEKSQDTFVSKNPDRTIRDGVLEVADIRILPIAGVVHEAEWQNVYRDVPIVVPAVSAETFVANSGVSLYLKMYERAIGTDDGVTAHYVETLNEFKKLAEHGVKKVRVLLCIGSKNTSGLKFAEDNETPIGFKDQELAILDVANLTRIGAETDIELTLALHNKDITETHPGVFSDEEKWTALVALDEILLNGAKEMLEEDVWGYFEYGEGLNEPDDAGMHSWYTQEFVKRVNIMIRNDIGKPVTLGPAKIEHAGNWLPLLKTGDMYQIHSYNDNLEELLAELRKNIGRFVVPEGVKICYGEAQVSMYDTESRTTNSILYEVFLAAHQSGADGVYGWLDNRFAPKYTLNPDEYLRVTEYVMSADDNTDVTDDDDADETDTSEDVNDTDVSDDTADADTTDDTVVDDTDEGDGQIVDDTDIADDTDTTNDEDADEGDEQVVDDPNIADDTDTAGKPGSTLDTSSGCFINIAGSKNLKRKNVPIAEVLEREGMGETGFEKAWNWLRSVTNSVKKHLDLVVMTTFGGVLWSSIVSAQPYANMILKKDAIAMELLIGGVAMLLFVGFILGNIILICIYNLKYSNRIKKNEFKVAVGITPAFCKKIGENDWGASFTKLMTKNDVEMIILVEDFNRETMQEEFNEKIKKNPKTKGKKVIGAVLDPSVLDGISDEDEFIRVIKDFIKTAKKEIAPLMASEVGFFKLKGLTCDAIKKDFDKLDKLTKDKTKKWYGIIKVLVRTLPMESLELVDKGAYHVPVNKWHRAVVGENRVSSEAKHLAQGGGGLYLSQSHKYVSVSAYNLADMRLIANAIRDLGINEAKASEFIHVRLRNDNVRTREQLIKYMKKTGLDGYLKVENVDIISEEEEKSMTLDKILGKVKHRFEEHVFTLNNSQIFVGSTKDLNLSSDDKAILSAGEKAPTFFQMEGEGIVSQLLLTLVEFSAAGEIPASLGKITSDPNNPGLKVYIYLPNIKKADYNAILDVIKNYEKMMTSV